MLNDELTPERIKEIETRWKSDVDRKLDAMIAFADEYRDFLKMLIKREARREALQTAIIEKGLTTLFIAAIAALATLAWNGAVSEARALMGILKK